MKENTNSNPDCKQEEERNLSVPVSEKAQKENLIAFDLCAKEARLDPKKMDV